MGKIKQCFSSVFANSTELKVKPAKAPITALVTWMAVMTMLFSQYLDSPVKDGYYETALFCGAGYIFSIMGFVCLYYIIFHNKKTGITFLLEAILTFTCFVWAAGLELEPSHKGRLLYITLLAFTLSMIGSFIIDRLVRSAKPSSAEPEDSKISKEDEATEPEKGAVEESASDQQDEASEEEDEEASEHAEEPLSEEK